MYYVALTIMLCIKCRKVGGTAESETLNFQPASNAGPPAYELTSNGGY